MIAAPIASDRHPPTSTRGVSLTPVRSGLWRVVDAQGRIIGHLEARTHERGVRFRARRFAPASRALRDLGDFWSADDAIDALRFAR